PLRNLTDAQKRDPAFIAGMIPIEPGCAVPRMKKLRAALATLPKAVLTAKLDQQLTTEYGKTTANQFLYLVDDPALWERAAKATDTDNYGAHDRSMYGFGDLGQKGLP